MATEDLLVTIPAELSDKISDYLVLFKAFGIFFILYVVWMIVKGVLTLRAFKRINEIYSDLKKIQKKLKVKK